MTSIPEVPGAAALYLNMEQTTDDDQHTYSYYVRLKVLNDKGKDYANVELRYYTGESGTSIDSIEGRTIHSDGSIVPFTGKPYDKFIARTADYKAKSKVFTLPAVDVGSIIEYRYKLRLDDDRFRSPDWYIQGDLFVRKAHYMWRPTNKDLIDDTGKSVSGRIAWSPILPPGVAVKKTDLPNGRIELSLDITNVPPMPTAESMPPLQSVSLRVLFFYTQYVNGEEFWKSTGKDWSKKIDKFIGSSNAVRDFANSLVAPTDSPDQKARKLYAAIMEMDNTDFSRIHSTTEEKAAGLRDIKNAEDVITRKRGSGDQLAATFVAMARAVGLKAFVMGVADRSERIFVPSYLSMFQIDDDIAILNIDGKDIFLDPGQRYCAYGHLAWPHALTGGIRQTDSGTGLSQVPPEPYTTAHNTRIADLKLDEQGVATGTVTLTFAGDSALNWRHRALRTDNAGLQEELKTSLEKLFPAGMDVSVAGIENLTTYEQPLKVKYDVKGPIGSPAGKRLLITPDIFLVNEKPRFTAPTREIAIDLHYAYFEQDAVRITLPPTLTIESAPEPAKEQFKNLALFITKSVRSANSITSQRTFQLGTPAIVPDEYPDFHTFYGKIATKDQEPLVLTRATPAASN
jgi:hypothetical protein